MSWVDEHEPEEDELRAALDEAYGEIEGVRKNTTKKRRRKALDHERKGAKGRESPVIKRIKELGDYYATSEVAAELGVSTQLIRKIAKNRETQAPSYVAPFGRSHVNLYTKDDIEAIREYLNKDKQVYTRDEYLQEEEDAT